MKVLFIYPNINGFHEDCYSLGLASIVSVTRLNGHQASVIIVRREEEFNKILERVAEFKPKVVGFSSVSSQFNFITKIASLIKARFPDVITVCGGVHPTINPQCIMETGSLDGIFVGESENSFVEFLKRAENNESYHNTDNFAYVDNGKVVINKLKPLIADLDSLPFPDKEVYPFKETLRTVGFAPFFFSRGCPYLCSYCSNHAIAKTYNLSRNYPRYRSPESSIREIEEVISKFPVKKILIGDDIFGLDKNWRLEFCEKYKKRIKIKFICLLRPDVIDEEFIRLLKSTGCFRISIGIESGNEYVRNFVMNRQITKEKIIKAFEIVHKYKVETNAINIIGLPHETDEMMWDTIQLNRKVKPTSSGVNIFYPYKGTRLGDYCFEKDMVQETLYNTFSNERRQTVLKYPQEYKRKLYYYRENWESLIYPFDFKRSLLRLLRKTVVWRHLRSLRQGSVAT
ncbi:MAG: radical SAM protein [Candidatus Omnitrophica bacterium]|nr:radical SAM protein [Candidatus Omnitrophota bacterium]